MKKQLYFLLANILVSFCLNGQTSYVVDSIQKISIQQTGGAFYPVLNNQGDKILVHSYASKGLMLYQLSNASLHTICPVTVACTNPVFSQNGDKVYYIQTKADKSEPTLMVYSMATKKSKELEQNKPMGELSWWDRIMAYWNASETDDANRTALKQGHLDYPFVKLEEGKIIHVTEQGSEEIDPLDARFYLHPSLSPSGNMVVANAIGKGCFVSKINGDDMMRIEDMEAPIWISDSVIAGMIPSDDGHSVKSSSIVIYDLTTKKMTTVLSPDKSGMYPSYNPTCHKLACHTPQGEIYIVHFNK